MTNVTKIVAALLVLLAMLLGVYAFVLARKPAPDTPATAQQTPAGVQTYPVLVADKLLPAGQVIDPAATRVVQLPIEPAGAFKTTEEITGKIPKFDIGAGVPLTADGMVRGLTLQIGEGERAVAVSVDEVVGSGNRVTPGDAVDVFFMLKQGQDAVMRTQSRLLLSRVRVLTYGDASVEGGAPAADPNLRGAPPAPARTAVLAVPVADVNRLLLAAQNGRLQLALRHPTDVTAPDPTLFPEPPTVLAGRAGLSPEQRESLKNPGNVAFAGSELIGLAGDARAQTPVAAPAPAARVASAPRPAPARPQARPQAPRAEPATVEVIRGTNRETVRF